MLVAFARQVDRSLSRPDLPLTGDLIYCTVMPINDSTKLSFVSAQWFLFAAEGFWLITPESGCPELLHVCSWLTRYDLVRLHRTVLLWLFIGWLVLYEYFRWTNMHYSETVGTGEVAMQSATKISTFVLTTDLFILCDFGCRSTKYSMQHATALWTWKTEIAINISTLHFCLKLCKMPKILQIRPLVWI
jgi:hypothetical protein